ncbi:RSC complex protein [Lentinula raphanica]|nr:RSC complex protein [Lentinula raphanica]
MPLTPQHKSAISAVLDVLLTAVATPPGTGRGRKRLLSGMFLIPLDRNDWAEYYDLIPNPRALHPIRDSLAENKYKDAEEVYTDLSLVFWNAIFYNERDSQISKDAAIMKNLLETEWAKHPELPQPRSRSPPPGSAQKAYPEVEEKEREREREEEREREREKLRQQELEKEANAKIIEAQDPPPQQPQLLSQTQAAPNTTTGVAEMEVDVSDSASETDQSADEGQGQYEADEDGGDDIDDDLIVTHLENSLPRWPGFSDDETEGWLAQGNTERYLELIHAVKGHKDVIGNRVATVLEAIPDIIDGPTSLGKENPISIKVIETRIKSKHYATPAAFDKDMMRLFEKARRWWEPSPAQLDPSKYAKVLILQRLYQNLTSPYPPERLKLGSSSYSSETNFAALRVGPGRVSRSDLQNSSQKEPVFASGSKRIHTISENQIFLEQVRYKGWTIRVGDWVHLANGSDVYSATSAGGGGGVGRPIVAQVWKIWKKKIDATKSSPNGVVANGDHNGISEKEYRYGVTVCWYYRPEETFHSPQRFFWENEVFKSSHFTCHPITDVLEPIFVQDTRSHIRGRPRGGAWYPGWPLYVCDSCYRGQLGQWTNNSAFVRIKRWNSCMPPDIPTHNSEASHRLLYAFEKTIYPIRRPSPFVVGGSGPGGLVADGVLGNASGPTKGALLVNSSDVAKSLTSTLQYLQRYTNPQTQSQLYSQLYQSYTQSLSAAAISKSAKIDRTSTAHAMAQTQGVQADFLALPKDTSKQFNLHT